MSDPAIKTFSFDVMVQNPCVEAISLLSQVMNTYRNLSVEEQQAIAAWFGGVYGEQDAKR